MVRRKFDEACGALKLRMNVLDNRPFKKGSKRKKINPHETTREREKEKKSRLSQSCFLSSRSFDERMLAKPPNKSWEIDGNDGDQES